MRGALRTTIMATAAVTAAVALYIGFTLPPASMALDGTMPATHIAGAYHVHSTASDGTGTLDDIAAAAARAGLGFVIVTDHGDGTRPPATPAYRHGVLIVDAVELNTNEGHLVALGLEHAAPYPLAGAARDVLEDVHRLGGFGIIAHPDSPKEDLRWRGPAAIADGLEWINADSEWRDKPAGRLVATGVRAMLRAPESIATLFGRPVRSLQRWDGAARQRPFAGLAATDAHALIGWREHEEPRRNAALKRPTYEAMFRTLVQVAVFDAPPAGDARADAEQLIAALRGGRSYSVVRALAWPAALTFEADGGEVRASMGERLPAGERVLTFRAGIPQAPGLRLRLLHDGRQVAAGLGALTHTSGAPGVYRVEAAFPGAAVPWLVSNPITIAADEAPANTGAPPLQESGSNPPEVHSIDVAGDRWRLEQDPRSRAAHSVENGQRRFDFQLAAGPPQGQYAALVAAVDEGFGIDRVRFVGRANRPLRVSVQVRLRDSSGGQRWARSVYLDQKPREIMIRLQDFDPVGPPTTRRPIVVPIQSLLFVIDTVNTAPGSEGSIALSEVTLGVGAR